MNKPSEIILHCAATPEGKVFTANDIDRMHKQRGFKKIGYHYVIDLNGEIEKGRSETETGAHCTGHNSKSIGICYIGGLAKDGKTPKDTRTEEQKESLYKLINKLLLKYNLTIDDVHCHYEYANKACPSFKIEKFKEEFNKWKKSHTNVLLTNLKNNNWKSKLFSYILKIIDYFLKK